MWAKFHEFNVNRLLLSQVAGRSGPNKLWEEELDFFMDLYREDCHMSFAEMITRYHNEDKHMHRSRTSIGAIYMPTMDTIINMKRTPCIVSMRDAEEYVQEALVRYECLFDTPDQFRVTYPASSPEDALQVMESFVRVTPLATKVGEMAFLCVCADAYQSYTCVEAIALSILFNPDLKVPDNLRAKQLKDRERAKLANQFTTKRAKDKTTEKDAEEAVCWKPKFSSFTAPQAGSAVAMAMAKRPARPAAAQVEAPAEDAPEAPAAPDPLQRAVDRKLLVSTRGSGPPRPSVHQPGLRRPILHTHARVRFQVLVRPSLVLTPCEAQRAASQPLQVEVVRNRLGKQLRGRGGADPRRNRM
jgi:hypothetical protein